MRLMDRSIGFSVDHGRTSEDGGRSWLFDEQNLLRLPRRGDAMEAHHE